MELNHIFRKRAHNLMALVAGCQKLSTYLNRLERQSVLFPDRYDPNDYAGDGFHLFVEALIKLSPVDNRIAISDFQVVEGLDTGVDGFGIGINGKPATVQCKFRGDKRWLLTANNDHLSNFLAASQNKYGVDINDKANMLIVTSGEGLHFFTEAEMLYGKVRCIGYKELRELVDNNIPFWNKFRELCS